MPVRSNGSAAPARRRTRAIVTLAAVAALGASAAACSSAGNGAADTALAAKPAADAELFTGLPAKLADDGTTVVVGKADAPHTVKVYLDPQCPFCAKFETGGGEGLAKAVRDGKAKAEYTVASFLDQGTEGASTRAANALRAALDAGKFAEYHAALYASQPQEGSAGAYSTEHLLKIADQVKGLRGAAFDKAVENMTYKDWVKKSEQAFEASGERGTPAILIDGKKVETQEGLFTADGFTKALQSA
ncbi:thioredoxin domain-containing protein [Streptomyces sp. TRM66268-LWL]|uniref:Thioredoxin domain-containing protein n=1 Tax=Streptomyces polyasparticus TaxID=2767826 RepID=A0ABR7SMA7_9ACTN|nr:thioredoxin domain-containing protein [Streptomyces polyasparticus]MBC9716568.1 thioredoxin domain-containing protein [Streptomyces polyasparticus]